MSLILAGILVCLQLLAVLPYRPGLRQSNVGFSAFVVLVGLGQLIFSFFRWRRWFAGYAAVFNIMVFANGVTWAVDTKQCVSLLR